MTGERLVQNLVRVGKHMSKSLILSVNNSISDVKIW